MTRDPETTEFAPGWGRRLMEARQRAGLSGARAAEAVKRTKSTISTYERERSTPEGWQVEALASLYGVSPDWIRTGDASLRPGLPDAAASTQPAEPVLMGPDPGFRLLCPVCSVSLDPRLSEAHMADVHQSSQPAADLEGAQRDPAPFLHKAELLRARGQAISDRRNSEKLHRSEARLLDAEFDIIMEWLEYMVSIGPEQFHFNEGEWPPSEG